MSGGWRIRPGGVTIPRPSTVDWGRLGSNQDPDRAGHRSTGQHAAAQTFRNSRAPRSQNVGPQDRILGHKKAVSRVFAGHGLDLLRARRDSNP
jgi:hypothetical protein